jgi:uncharacterized membrane protein
VTFTTTMERVAQGFEAFAVVVLIVGLLWSLTAAASTWRSAGERAAYHRLRETFGNVLLLALEIFVAADLIRTVAVAPTVENVAVLGLIVLIRTFLSISLEVEIDGMLPWRRGPQGVVRDQPARRPPRPGAGAG